MTTFPIHVAPCKSYQCCAPPRAVLQLSMHSVITVMRLSTATAGQAMPMFPLKPSSGWVSQNMDLNLAGLCYTQWDKFTSPHIIKGKKKTLLKNVAWFWLNEDEGVEREKPCLLFEHIFVFNYLQLSHCSGTGGYKMLTFLQQHPSYMFSFPLLKRMAQFIPGPPLLFATIIYDHKTCTCNFKPTFELWAKVN